jgi:acyl-CoA thioesterase FadM
MEDVLGVTNDDVMERGYQFFIRRSEFEYLRSVNGCQRLYVRSFVTQQRGPLMSVSFEICDRSQTTVFCKGIFDFVLVDSHQRLVRRVPEWITQLFLRPEPDTDQLDVQP